jgi:hypothetical protein
MPSPVAQGQEGAGSSNHDALRRDGRSFLINDAARLMGVSRRTVYYRIRAGLLLTIRTRCGSQRVLLSSIEALLDERRNAGTSADLNGGEALSAIGSAADHDGREVER